jgi:hypothetical protein
MVYLSGSGPPRDGKDPGSTSIAQGACSGVAADVANRHGTWAENNIYIKFTGKDTCGYLR